MNKIKIASWGLVILSFLIGIYLYPQLPEKFASHWGISGQADGYYSLFFGVFLIPFISTALLVVLTLIPKIDPLKSNIEKFKKYFDWFVFILVLFLFYIFLLTLSWNLDYRFDMNRAIAPALALIFYFAGFLMKKSERNWFIGVRTPWTLSSDDNWRKTNDLGGKLFIVSSFLALMGLFLPEYLFYLVIVPVIVSVIYTVLFSYLEFKKEKK